ncbi:hypothetical protein [Longirhabdus pacifica]|uniref:hypothetical protein n=1 Tax=Longirhabdus pacifica TaxID=2305227 RepID=UPI001008F8C6|nr:hypothetical protein [Longirhabdus pacifica]
MLANFLSLTKIKGDYVFIRNFIFMTKIPISDIVRIVIVQQHFEDENENMNNQKVKLKLYTNENDYVIQLKYNAQQLFLKQIQHKNNHITIDKTSK